MTAQELINALDRLGIANETHRHDPVYTVAEAKEKRGDLPGGHCKNLFVRNKKGVMWLIVSLEDQPIDLKKTGLRLGLGRLSFASAERLRRYLGLEPGAVTPFGIVHDTEGAVEVILDRRLFAFDRVSYHPLRNDRTTCLSPEGLVAFLRAFEHEPRIVDL